MSESLTKDEIIRKRGDIQALFKSRRNLRSDMLGMKVRHNGLTYCRLLVVPLREGKKLSSVERNALRRCGKELYRRNRALLRGCAYDILLLLGRDILSIPFDKRTSRYRSLLLQLKLWTRELY